MIALASLNTWRNQLLQRTRMYLALKCHFAPFLLSTLRNYWNNAVAPTIYSTKSVRHYYWAMHLPASRWVGLQKCLPSVTLQFWAGLRAGPFAYQTSSRIIYCDQHHWVIMSHFQFVRENNKLTQYHGYLKFVQEVGRTCGFEVEEDSLRIPSTKRVGVQHT